MRRYYWTITIEADYTPGYASPSCSNHDSPAFSDPGEGPSFEATISKSNAPAAVERAIVDAVQALDPMDVSDSFDNGDDRDGPECDDERRCAMSETTKCPGCGSVPVYIAGVNGIVGAVHHWLCGSTPVGTSEACLRRQLAAVTRERDEAREALREALKALGPPCREQPCNCNRCLAVRKARSVLAKGEKNG